MLWVDIIILLLVILLGWWGWRRGLAFVVVDLLGFFLGLAVALAVASLLIRSTIPLPLVIIIVFFITNLLFWSIVRPGMRGPIFRRPLRISRAFGAATGAVEAVVICALALGALVSFPTGPGQKIASGPVARAILPIGTKAARAISAAAPQEIRRRLTFFTLPPEAKARISIQPRTDISVDAQAETQMLVLVNRERVSENLPPLRMDPALRQVARAHSADMFKRGYFGHIDPQGVNPFDRMHRGGIAFLTAGENVALAPTVEFAHEGLMGSPGHRANILGRGYGRIGIGVYSSGIGGRMFTQVFAD